MPLSKAQEPCLLLQTDRLQAILMWSSEKQLQGVPTSHLS